MTAPTVARSTIETATLVTPGVTRIEEAPLPEPASNEVLVRIEGCGVCASSLPVWQGRPWFDYPVEPGAPGHEAWGTEVESGRRVALLYERGFAEYACVPRVGAGFLGLLLVQLCAGAGRRVLAFSRRPFSLELARMFGAETPAAPEDESCDVVIEAGGVQETLELASRLCRVRGRLVIAGFHQDGPRSVDLQLWNWRGLDVVNAHEREAVVVLEGIRAAAQAAAQGQLDPEPLYTHVFSLDELDAAFAVAAARPDGFVKALVTA